MPLHQPSHIPFVACVWRTLLSTLPQRSSLTSRNGFLLLHHAGRITRLSTYASCEAHYEKTSLQKGVLVEFQKDSGRILLGVTQNREGKKNWNIIDQNADTCIVRPKQIKLIVPGAENFSPDNVTQLLHQVELLQDPTLLEIAWEETLARNKTVDIEELALILYGSTTPEKCYSAYRLLSSNPVYFKCKDDGYSPIYEPRPLSQVKELQLQQSREALAHKELEEFVTYMKSVIQLPCGERPTQSSWTLKEEFKTQLAALKAFALESCNSSEQKETATQVLEALGVCKSPAAALSVMIQMGYFATHENIDLLRLDLRIEFPSETLAETEAIKSQHPYDLDKDRRVDLTALKVYTIDTDDPDEIDDGLSAVQLPDGRIKVWIHVADPTRWVGWDSMLRKEASHRCTSIYLPTMTVPMFPMELATEYMSLRQGQCCSAISVSVILSHDGSVSESIVETSIIRPTYQLSYETASELLSLGVEEEAELSLLHQAAVLRNKWRLSNGALNFSLPNPKVRVEGEETSDPYINVSIEDQTSPSAILVSEMMILCGEIIAAIGGERGLCLPYRGQAQNEEMKNEFCFIPEGPARSVALIRCLSRSDMSFVKPLHHAGLGLAGYVQFTSPIRRYVDLLAHYQIKAVLRGEEPPLSGGYLEASMATINARCKTARKLQSDSDRYWILEYLRRQPSDRKYHACILRFVKNTIATVWLTEVGIQTLIDLQTKRQVGGEIVVYVQDAQPRKNVLILRET